MTATRNKSLLIPKLRKCAVFYDVRTLLQPWLGNLSCLLGMNTLPIYTYSAIEVEEAGFIMGQVVANYNVRLAHSTRSGGEIGIPTLNNSQERQG